MDTRRLLVGLALWSGVASADVLTLVSTRTSLGGNDSIGWGQLGASLTIFNSPRTVTSALGLSAAVTDSSGSFYANQETNIWMGNFAPDDNLIATGQFTPAGPIDITFATPVFGLGAQMGYNVVTSTPTPFTEGIRVYDAANNLLADFTQTGTMDNANDNSAVFIGVTDSTGPNIAKVEFYTSSTFGSNPGSFAINKVSLVDTPEPAGYALAGLGVAMAALLRTRRGARD